MPLPPGIATEPVDAGGVRAEWQRPTTDEPQRTLLHLHGGGYMLGSIATHRNLTARLALAARARCLSIDYRLAPEHPFPAAVDDALTAYRWLLDSGVPARRLVVSGDSAGGGLALGLVVAARGAGLPLPAAVVALSPLTDLEATGGSASSADDPLLTGGREALLQMAQTYLQGADPRDPRASPLHADFRGFPPLLLQVGTREVLLDDSTRVAERARAAGVDVTLDRGEGLIHVWPLFGADMPESVAAVERIGEFIRKHA
jgi:acetyl esterase/lipase